MLFILAKNKKYTKNSFVNTVNKFKKKSTKKLIKKSRIKPQVPIKFNQNRNIFIQKKLEFLQKLIII